MGKKGGKLTKMLKSSVIKKWNSFSKLGRSTNSSSIVAAPSHSSSDDDDSYNNNNVISKSSRNLHPVYVGKSRRRYLVSSDVMDNPVFRELVERSTGDYEEGGTNHQSVTVVGCEVVLFEHLLWMLENADPQPESLDDFVEYYAC